MLAGNRVVPESTMDPPGGGVSRPAEPWVHFSSPREIKVNSRNGTGEDGFLWVQAPISSTASYCDTVDYAFLSTHSSTVDKMLRSLRKTCSIDQAMQHVAWSERVPTASSEQWMRAMLLRSVSGRQQHPSGLPYNGYRRRILSARRRHPSSSTLTRFVRQSGEIVVGRRSRPAARSAEQHRSKREQKKRKKKKSKKPASTSRKGKRRTQKGKAEKTRKRDSRGQDRPGADTSQRKKKKRRRPQKQTSDAQGPGAASAQLTSDTNSEPRTVPLSMLQALSTKLNGAVEARDNETRARAQLAERLGAVEEMLASMHQYRHGVPKPVDLSIGGQRTSSRNLVATSEEQKQPDAAAGGAGRARQPSTPSEVYVRPAVTHPPQSAPDLSLEPPNLTPSTLHPAPAPDSPRGLVQITNDHADKHTNDADTHANDGEKHVTSSREAPSNEQESAGRDASARGTESGGEADNWFDMDEELGGLEEPEEKAPEISKAPTPETKLSEDEDWFGTDEPTEPPPVAVTQDPGVASPQTDYASDFFETDDLPDVTSPRTKEQHRARHRRRRSSLLRSATFTGVEELSDAAESSKSEAEDDGGSSLFGLGDDEAPEPADTAPTENTAAPSAAEAPSFFGGGAGSEPAGEDYDEFNLDELHDDNNDGVTATANLADHDLSDIDDW